MTICAFALSRHAWELNMGQSSFAFAVAIAAAAMVAHPGTAAAQDGPKSSRDDYARARENPKLKASVDDLFRPRFQATGEFQLVRLVGEKRERTVVLKTFGGGVTGEQSANAALETEMATWKPGDAPVIVRNQYRHYRCPKRPLDSTPKPSEIMNDVDSGPPSNLDCDAINVKYTLPADPTAEVADVECKIDVDVDVLVVGRRVKSIRWQLAQDAGDVSGNPQMRLLDVALDPNNRLVRGITFHDNNMHPRERDETPAGNPENFDMFEGAMTDPSRGQWVTWSRDDSRRRLPKSLYYAVVLQYWSTNLKHYVYCKPYDPLAYNKGN